MRRSPWCQFLTALPSIISIVLFMSPPALAEDPTDDALKLFKEICLETLPRHAGAANRIRSSFPNAEREIVPDAYESWFMERVQIDVSLDVDGQTQFFCNVSANSVDRERLTAELPELVKRATGATPEAGGAPYEHGAWQVQLEVGVVFFGLMTYDAAAGSNSVTLTIVRNVAG